MEQIVQLEHASEKVTENLRKIDDHVLHNVDTPAGGRRSIEQARQLFVEQLEYLDKEK
jgi:hypothetical protein